MLLLFWQQNSGSWPTVATEKLSKLAVSEPGVIGSFDAVAAVVVVAVVIDDVALDVVVAATTGGEIVGTIGAPGVLAAVAGVVSSVPVGFCFCFCLLF